MVVEAKKYLETPSEKIQKKKEGKLALSALITLVVCAGLAAGLDCLVKKEAETEVKDKLYFNVQDKADKDTNNDIDYEEAYNLGRKLNVIPETNLCPLTSFDEMFNKATLKNISNYLKN